MSKTPVIFVSDDLALRQRLWRECASVELEWSHCENRARAIERGGSLGRAVYVFASSSLAASFEDVRTAKELRQEHRYHPVVMIVEEGSEDLMLAALRAGVNDVLRVRDAATHLPTVIHRLLHPTEERGEVSLDPIVGNSRSIQELRVYLAKVAATDSNVLITGETGTGKELAAEMLHSLSPRRNRRMVPVNCAAIPDALVESELFGHERGAFTGAHAAREGKFQLAEGGTVFLDEIGDMDIGAQAKLLRVLENKEVYTLGARSGTKLNVRVIAATNQDPEQLVLENRFRKDLYFRLNVARIHLVPLRERKEDIPALVQHAIAELNGRFTSQVEGCSEASMALLLCYDWPGNVRELRNLLEATFIGLNSRWITPEDFPPAFQRRLQAQLSLPSRERDRVLSALSATNWNVSKAAETLRWSRMTLYRKLAKYQMSREQDHPAPQKLR